MEFDKRLHVVRSPRCICNSAVCVCHGFAAWSHMSACVSVCICCHTLLCVYRVALISAVVSRDHDVRYCLFTDRLRRSTHFVINDLYLPRSLSPFTTNTHLETQSKLESTQRVQTPPGRHLEFCRKSLFHAKITAVGL